MKSIDIHVHVPAPPGHPVALEAQKMAEYFKSDALAKQDFEKLDLKPEIRRKILLDDACKLLKLPGR